MPMFPGQAGTIWFDGIQGFEHWGDKQKTSEAYNHRERTTLDYLGYIDVDGHLYLSARRTDLVISGVVNI